VQSSWGVFDKTRDAQRISARDCSPTQGSVTEFGAVTVQAMFKKIGHERKASGVPGSRDIGASISTSLYRRTPEVVTEPYGIGLQHGTTLEGKGIG